MNYDEWKLMTPEQAAGIENLGTVTVRVPVELYDVDDDIISLFRCKTSEVLTYEDSLERDMITELTVDVFLSEDGDGLYLSEDDVECAIGDLLGGCCDYHIVEYPNV